MTLSWKEVMLLRNLMTGGDDRAFDGQMSAREKEEFLAKRERLGV
jgi:hypothetical protein